MAAEALKSVTIYGENLQMARKQALAETAPNAAKWWIR